MSLKTEYRQVYNGNASHNNKLTSQTNLLLLEDEEKNTENTMFIFNTLYSLFISNELQRYVIANNIKYINMTQQWPSQQL